MSLMVLHKKPILFVSPQAYYPGRMARLASKASGLTSLHGPQLVRHQQNATRSPENVQPVNGFCLVVCLFVCLFVWLFVCLVGWLVGWLVGFEGWLLLMRRADCGPSSQDSGHWAGIVITLVETDDRSGFLPFPCISCDPWVENSRPTNP